MQRNTIKTVEQPAQPLDKSAAVVAGGVPSLSSKSMVDIFIAQARHENEIIARMTLMVVAGDKDAVFELAKELTCVKN